MKEMQTSNISKNVYGKGFDIFVRKNSYPEFFIIKIDTPTYHELDWIQRTIMRHNLNHNEYHLKRNWWTISWVSIFGDLMAP